MSAANPREAGFTLVEMLVALFAFSLLSAATLTAMTQTFRARAAVEVALDEMEGIALLDSLMREDLRNAVTRPTRDSFGTPERVSFQLYAPDGSFLVLTRDGRINPGGLAPRGDLMRIAYRLEDGELVRETPALPTPTATTPMRRRVLLSGIRRMDVSAYAGDRELLQVNVPPQSTELPERLEVSFDLGGRGTLRHVFEVGR